MKNLNEVIEIWIYSVPPILYYVAEVKYSTNYRND